MRVVSLSTLGFRNLAPGEVELGEGVTLLHGANGAGKTNILEALYMGLAGRSCRTRADRETIAFGEPLSRAEVVIEDQGERREFLCAVDRESGRRHLVNGSVMPDAASLRPPVAVFMPDRLTLVKGPPAARRSHLDGFVAALRPARAEARRRYSRALAQRNALVSRIRARAASVDSLDAWDAEVAEAGVELMDARAGAVDVLAPLFATAAGELGLEAPELRYAPRSKAVAAEELRAELAERRESDLGRGFSGHGPHLDEVAIDLGGKAVRKYASQGQQRSALLALLFAERDALLAERSEPPLMLLDDVTSELDPERRELLCERLSRGGGRPSLQRLRARICPRRASASSSRSEAARPSAASTARSRRREPAEGRAGPARSLAAALEAVRSEVAPQTLLAAVQESWSDAAGSLVAAQGDPVSERSGVVTVACRSATWAQELDLMSPILLEKLREALALGPFSEGLEGLRFTADAARGDFG